MAKRKLEESAIKNDQVKVSNSDKKNKKKKNMLQKEKVDPATPTQDEQVKVPNGNNSEKKNKLKQDDRDDAHKSTSDKQQVKGPKGKKKSKKWDSAKRDDPEKEEEAKETWSKSKRKRMRMLLGKQRADDLPEGSDSTSSKAKKQQENKMEGVVSEPATKDDKKGKKSSLQDAFKAQLSGSRFRILNEELYTTTSKESLERFSKNPELFEQYHEGFRHQVEVWPVNPVDVIVRSLSNNYRKGSCVVADFGCGDAQLAKDLLKVEQPKKGKCPFTVHSFDLVSNNELVTACDMANIPLESKSVDVCVFCLSLMGTNLADFIREAHRVLKDDGRVMIAEVRSRIEYSHAPAERSNHKKQNTKNADAARKDNDKEKTAGTLSEFVDVLAQLGFESVRTDRKNKMFLLIELKKNKKVPNQKLAFTAKPCIYKRR
jgi:ubiquinone/menaquinone biosynthesis C-methylase UbiE